METGVSGYVDFTGTKGFTLRVHYSETYNTASNKRDVTITKLQIAGSQYYGDVYYLDGTIQVNGTTAVEMDSFQGTHAVSVDGQDTFFDANGTLGSVTGIAGSQSVTITADVTGYSMLGLDGNGWTVTGSEAVEVTPAGVVRVNISGTFKMAQAWVYTNGIWKPTIPHLHDGTSWKLPG